MQETSTRVFGRRIPPGWAPSSEAPRRAQPTISAIDLSALPAETAREQDESDSRQRVPRSRRAALLAGLVVGCLYMGMALHGGTPHVHDIAGVAMPPLDPTIALSAVAASGLLAGLRGAVGSLFILRVGLNALGLTDILAYALAGGVLTTADGAAMQALGVGLPDHGFAFAAVAGAATAALFRVFAGVTKV